MGAMCFEVRAGSRPLRASTCTTQRKRRSRPTTSRPTCFLRAIEIAHAQEARLLELRAAAHLARLWRDTTIMSWYTDTETLMTAGTAENAGLLQGEGRGPLTSNIAEAGGFVRTRAGLEA